MTLTRLLCGLVAATLLTGCATATSDPRSAPAASTTPTPSAEPSTALPTLTPASRPPNEPTDRIKDADWVVGTVVRGGDGPCYGLETDDGTQYALHSTQGNELTRASRVRAKITPSRLKINCGAGSLVELIEVVPVR